MRNYLWSHQVVWSRESATIPMPNIYPIGWYLFDAPARFLAILICPQRVIDIPRMIVCTTQRFYLKIASRCLLVCEPSLSPLVWERYYIHSGRWMKRAAPFRKDQKENFFFRESYLREKNSSFQLASLELQASLQNTGSTSIEYRATNDSNSVATADEEADLFVGNESRVFPESFPFFVPGTSTKAESTYVLSNNRIDPCRVSARELLKLLALFRPSRVIIQPQADRTAKSHESRRNTTVKLKRSKTPWLSWWHCNKIATCSLHLGGIKVLMLNEQRDEM